MQERDEENEGEGKGTRGVLVSVERRGRRKMRGGERDEGSTGKRGEERVKGNEGEKA